MSIVSEFLRSQAALKDGDPKADEAFDAVREKALAAGYYISTPASGARRDCMIGETARVMRDPAPPAAAKHHAAGKVIFDKDDGA